ncbi:MAG: hydroxyacid dehydrogenase [Alphaproteobacteria bacterium]|nr:hydroxyacid dehydrogenase [Alphaproteobacteria bacterium]
MTPPRPGGAPLRVHQLAPLLRQDALEDALPPGLRLSLGPPRGEVDVLVAVRPSAEDLDRTRQALVLPCAGVPPRTLALLRERPGLQAWNLHHNARAVAEHAMALMLASTKLLIPVDRRFREFDWRQRFAGVPSLCLGGRTALLLGYGAIGRRLARALSALDIRVLATRRSAREVQVDPHAEVHPAAALRALLPQAQLLFLCLPHTPETEGLIDAEALALLPPGATLINVARANIVDEAALYEALRGGRLHSAGLDVWYRYPRGEAERAHTPPSTLPFHELDNVVMSPHRAGHGELAELERAQALAEVLRALAAGEAPASEVRPERGY